MKSRLLIYVAGSALLAGLLSSAPAAATAPSARAAPPTTWQNHGPFGGFIKALAVSSTSPPTLWASTSIRNYFEPPPGQTSMSQDGGRTWSLVEGLATLPIGTLAADPIDPNILLAGSDSSIYRSEDAGQTWTIVATTASVNDIAFDASNDQIVYAAIRGQGILKSSDNGRSWVNVKSGTRLAVAVDPADPSYVYAGSETGAVVSSDAGATWSKSQEGFPRRKEPIYSLIVDPAGSGKVFAGTIDGLFVSTDHGATWSGDNHGIGLRNISSIVMSPSDSQLLYAGAGRYVIVSHDGGTSWSDASTGLPRIKVASLALDPTNDQHLWAGTGHNGGVFESTNGGGRWQDRSAGLANGNVGAAAVPATDAERVYAGMDVTGGVMRTDDRGGTWHRAGAFTDFVEAMAVDPTDADTAYAAGLIYGINKTTDGGRTWSLLPRSPHAPYLIAASTTILYASDYFQVYSSTDAGATWQDLGAPLPGFYVRDLASDPSNPDIVYAGVDAHGVYKTQDAGETWSPTGVGIRSPTVASIAVDPSRPQDVYVAVGDLYRSTDAGASWSLVAMHGCEDSGHALYVAVDPARRGTVYVDEGRPSNIGGGAHVCRSANGGATWSDLPAIAENNPYVVVTDLLVSSDGSTLYAVPRGAGLYSIRVH